MKLLAELPERGHFCRHFGMTGSKGPLEFATGVKRPKIGRDR